MVDTKFRYEMNVKGFMNQKELARFIPCGKMKAKQIFNSIMLEVEKEGLEPIDKYTILTKRANKIIGKSADDIYADYTKGTL